MTTPLDPGNAPPAPRPPRPVVARFADWSAVVGFWVMLLQWVLLQWIVVGFGIAGAMGRLAFPIDTAEVATWLAVAAAVAWFGVYIWRFTRRCRVVRVVDDGTWILRNCIGRELGRIAPDTPRRIANYSQRVRSFGPSVRIWTRSYAEIEVAGRTWQTCRSVPKVTARAIEQLQGTLAP